MRKEMGWHKSTLFLMLSVLWVMGCTDEIECEIQSDCANGLVCASGHCVVLPEMDADASDSEEGLTLDVSDGVDDLAGDGHSDQEGTQLDQGIETDGDLDDEEHLYCYFDMWSGYFRADNSGDEPQLRTHLSGYCLGTRNVPGCVDESITGNCTRTVCSDADVLYRSVGTVSVVGPNTDGTIEIEPDEEGRYSAAWDGVSWVSGDFVTMSASGGDMGTPFEVEGIAPSTEVLWYSPAPNEAGQFEFSLSSLAEEFSWEIGAEDESEIPEHLDYMIWEEGGSTQWICRYNESQTSGIIPYDLIEGMSHEAINPLATVYGMTSKRREDNDVLIDWRLISPILFEGGIDSEEPSDWQGPVESVEIVYIETEEE
jgi:hypothetical protein